MCAAKHTKADAQVHSSWNPNGRVPPASSFLSSSLRHRVMSHAFHMGFISQLCSTFNLMLTPRLLTYTPALF